MKKNRVTVPVVLAILVCAVIVSGCLLDGTSMEGTGINDSEAISIVLSDANASEYYTSYFHVEDWRVTTTTLVNATPNGSTSDDGVWKVEIMERTCACSGVKPLLVIEGYVSASDGELFEVSTKYVSESEYDKATCSSTACH